MASTAGLTQDLETFLKEMDKAEKDHEEYLKALKDMTKRQEGGAKAVKHLNYLYAQLRADLKKLDAKKEQPSDEERARLEDLRNRAAERRLKIGEMERELPAGSNGLYLSIILGSNLNVSLLSPDERYRYKEEYERFKVTVTYVMLAMLFLAYMFPYRAIDALCNFLMVWYYCTLTIRESILRTNGSRIKGWWVMHHYISCVLCGITLTWRDGECYKMFRPVFLFMSVYVGTVQVLQHSYQTGCLRRLHALGQRHSMDITLEGFSNWMFKGLTFLLPFLVLGYVIQGYCAYFLYDMYFNRNCTEDWQVLALAILFTTVAMGNVITISLVIMRKIAEIRSSETVSQLVSKYAPKKTV